MPGRQATGSPRLIGGAPCLDLVNTVGSWRDPGRTEKLHTYADLLEWSRRTGLLNEEVARRLRRVAARRPAAAARVLRQALALRLAFHNLFTARLQGAPTHRRDLGLLNAALARAAAFRRLAPTADGLEWEWAMDGETLDAMLWPIARSAAELLTDDAADIRACANRECGWLFLDTSRNHSRRWCSMEVCGNRSKVQSYLARERQHAGQRRGNE